MLNFKNTRHTLIFACLILTFLAGTLQAYYTTQGQNIIHRETGEVVQLRGFGLGGWLLPEGYMWGIRKLDRPRHFEAAIEDLIGPEDARKFWDLYYEHFVTRKDVEMMKSWGVNTIRVPLLASMIQPREGQPAEPPFVYDAHNFKFIDNFVDWCEEIGMGVIWDLHGAPGGQNAENISDSDGEARLWTEKSIYWPLTIDLWDTITRRYADKKCIVGYDLLNEPLLGRYPGIDPGLLRELYVLLTQKIRETDKAGIIFIEGDDWAQDFTVLEPMDWDDHLVLGFHSYPPTYTQDGLNRWDAHRQKYDMPLWHGETGEQNPPWELYKRSSRFLESSNVSWNWWTHKKFELYRQPWSIHRTEGFDKILEYWNGNGKRPFKWQAKRWLFKQARMTNSLHCEFLPGMVESLHPLDPSEQVKEIGITAPEIVRFPGELVIREGYAAVLKLKTTGYPLNYQWYWNDVKIPGANELQLSIQERPLEKQGGLYSVEISNEKGRVRSANCNVSVQEFEGVTIEKLDGWIPEIDGVYESQWESVEQIRIEHEVSGQIDGAKDLDGWFSATWDDSALYIFVGVHDDIVSTDANIDYLRDGIEVYLDTDNSKSAFFGKDEFQLRVVADSSGIYSDLGHSLAHTPTAQQVRADGYNIELSIPWENLNGSPQKFLGLDIHINDNDGKTRHGKMAWHCTRDNAYQSPANFGTVRLSNN